MFFRNLDDDVREMGLGALLENIILEGICSVSRSKNAFAEKNVNVPPLYQP